MAAGTFVTQNKAANISSPVQDNMPDRTLLKTDEQQDSTELLYFNKMDD